MRPISVRFVSGFVLAVLLCTAPAGLAAEGRRGAAIRVLKADGPEVPGELISVGSDSLVLRQGGADWTIPRGRVRSVTIMRRSRLASGALTGFTFGAIAGISWGIGYGDSHAHGTPPLVQAGAIAGGLGLVIGMAASRREKVDSVIPFAGLPGPAAAENWDALRPYSREARRAKNPRRP